MFALRKCALTLSALFFIAILTVLQVAEGAAQEKPAYKQPGYQKSRPHQMGCVSVPEGCKCVQREAGCCLAAGNCYRR